MQTSYHITNAGVKRLTATSYSQDLINDDIYQLLILTLNRHINTTVSFSDASILFNYEKARTFKVISKMLSLQLIDMNESSNANSNEETLSAKYFLSNLQVQSQYILSDLNGFPIIASGFNQQQTVDISAIAYDYIKASRRSRHINKISDTNQPLSITTSWADMSLTIYLLYFDKFSCLLTTTDSNFLNSSAFIEISSYVCNRYNYE